jgi:hypothetical protein
MFLKLTTICDVGHVISFLLGLPSSSLFFSHKRGRPGDEANKMLYQSVHRISFNVVTNCSVFFESSWSTC